MTTSKEHEEVTQAEAAKRLGITPQALGVWTRRPGAPVVLRKGRPMCIWPDFPRWRDAERERQVRQESKPDSAVNAELRYETARATKMEMEVAVLERTLVPADETAEKVGAVLGGVRSQILNLPQRLAPEMVGVKSIQEARAKLDDGVAGVLEALSGGIT